ncbi:MAG: hypothetical protein ACI9OH_000493 [Oleispira sp.]|jgi:hypothetical protein
MNEVFEVCAIVNEQELEHDQTEALVVTKQLPEK